MTSWKWLLGLGPAAAIAVRVLAPGEPVWVFASAALAIPPLAVVISRSTGALADRLGDTFGGLLNATFGNAAELIIGVLALRRGLTDLVKASLTGSILANLLLVFGTAALAGGVGRPIQRFNRTAASSGATLLILSTIGLVVPAVFHRLSGTRPDSPELRLDAAIAAILILVYVLNLVFTLKTHRSVYAASRGHGVRESSRIGPPLAQLAGATALAAYMSELMVGSVSEAATRLGMTHLFVGVVIVAIVGNAAEHYSAVVMAIEDRMDATLAIAIGSSLQIALFVAPVLVIASFVIAPQPMDLRFTVYEVAAIVMAVAIIAFISHDGETHWLEGSQLLAVYVILVLGFYFLPA